MTTARDAAQQPTDPGAGTLATHTTADGMAATAFGLTDIGCQRSVNQDTLGNRLGDYAARAADLGLLYAVADGMGGHARGEDASQLAIAQLFARYYAADPQEEPRKLLGRVLIETNAAVFGAGREAGGAAMGTTLTLALLRNGALFVGNIGDSRTYCLRGGQIEQLTHDHSLIGEQVRNGLLTEEQARKSSIRNVITRAVGYRDQVEPDVFTFPVAVGDIILLCSDGLHSLVESRELAQILGGQPLDAAVPALIELAKQRGGSDNITALAVRVDQLGASSVAREDATTVPMTPALDDAVTKPLVRVEGEAAPPARASSDSGPGAPAAVAAAAAAPAAVTAPAASAAAPPSAAPAASAVVPPRGAMPPSPLASPPGTARAVPPPAGRSPGRFTVGLLIVLPLLLLMAVGAVVVSFGRADQGGQAVTTSTAASASAEPSAVAAVAPTPTAASAASASGNSPGISRPPQTPATVGVAATATAAAAARSTGPTQPTPPIAGITPTINLGGGDPGTNTTRSILAGTVRVAPRPGGGTAPRLAEEWEVVLYAASAFPTKTLPERPAPASFGGVTPTWTGAIQSAQNGLFPFDVQGQWTLGGSEEAVIVALRNKANPARVALPEQTRVTVFRDRQPPAHQITLVDPLE